MFRITISNILGALIVAVARTASYLVAEQDEMPGYRSHDKAPLNAKSPGFGKRSSPD
jgi:hypothetical protein